MQLGIRRVSIEESHREFCYTLYKRLDRHTFASRFLGLPCRDVVKTAFSRLILAIGRRGLAHSRANIANDLATLGLF